MKEQEIVEKLRMENEEFKKIGKEHRDLESRLQEIDKKIYLTPDEEMERKRVQKQKLLRKDRMAEIIRDFKRSQTVS